MKITRLNLLNYCYQPTCLYLLTGFHLQSPQQRGHLFPFLHLLLVLFLFLLSCPNQYLLLLVTIILPTFLFNLALLNLLFPTPTYLCLLLLLPQSKVLLRMSWLLILQPQRAPLLAPNSKLLMFCLYLTWEHLVARSLKEPILMNFWKGLKICAMITECQPLRKSDAYFGIARCLLPGMSGWS